MDVWFTELYFSVLSEEAYADPQTRREYEGLLRVLHDIPFTWYIWQDEDRAGDALSYRHYDFLSTQGGVEGFADTNSVHAWLMASPSVLEVLLAICRRWSTFYERPTSSYFGLLIHNLGLGRELGFAPLPITRQTRIRRIIDIWVSRQFDIDGRGSPFPLEVISPDINMTTMDIWSQMNLYAAQHPRFFN